MLLSCVLGALLIGFASGPLTAFCFGWSFAEDWGAAGRAGGFELHVFDAGEVGVEEVELDLSIFAHLRLGAVGAFALVAGEGCDDVGHLVGAEREVVEDAEGFG